MKTFAVLIPTIPKHRKTLMALMMQMTEQVCKYQVQDHFCVYTLEDSKDKDNSIGAKRNRLLDFAVADKIDYVAFIDSDDRISADYMKQVFTGIAYEPDCCSLNGIITVDGQNPKEFKHSISYKGWYEDNGIYYRYPNHLNCIKTEIADQIRFPENSFGEDKDFSMRLMESGLIKTEHVIEYPIYYYDYIYKK